MLLGIKFELLCVSKWSPSNQKLLTLLIAVNLFSHCLLEIENTNLVLINFLQLFNSLFFTFNTISLYRAIFKLLKITESLL